MKKIILFSIFMLAFACNKEDENIVSEKELLKDIT